VDYAETVLEEIDDDRIVPFVAPLSPFLDPGSPAFENPDEYGYDLLAETLEEHRQMLLEPSWKRMLSYETEHLSRDDLVSATYEAARRMNRLKYEHGLLDEETYHDIIDRIEDSQRVVDRVDEIRETVPDDERDEALQELAAEVPDYGEWSIAGEDELWWQSDGLRNALALGRLGTRIVFEDLKRRFRRRRPLRG